MKGPGTGRSIVDMCLTRARDGIIIPCWKSLTNWTVQGFGFTWHVFQDVLLVCTFLIFLFTMISVEQWRSSIGCFSAHGSWVVSV